MISLHAQTTVDAQFMTFGEEADYTPKGQATRSVLIIPDLSYETTNFGDSVVTQKATVFDVRASDIDVPNEGDKINYNGVIYFIHGIPQYKDARRLIWVLNVVEDD